MMKSIISILLVAFVAVNGFSTQPPKKATANQSVSKTTTNGSFLRFDNNNDNDNSFDVDDNVHKNVIKQTCLAVSLSLFVLLSTSAPPAFAADFAGKDITGKDFSGQTLTGKDFSKSKASQANFQGANLQGANFQGANLVKADFSGAILDDVKFDDAALDGTIMKDVLARRTSFGKTILDIGDLENADLTNSIWPSKYRVMICDMTDEIKGENKITGADTRGTVYCNSELKYSN